MRDGRVPLHRRCQKPVTVPAGHMHLPLCGGLPCGCFLQPEGKGAVLHPHLCNTHLFSVPFCESGVCFNHPPPPGDQILSTSGGSGSPLSIHTAVVRQVFSESVILVFASWHLDVQRGEEVRTPPPRLDRKIGRPGNIGRPDGGGHREVDPLEERTQRKGEFFFVTGGVVLGSHVAPTPMVGRLG